MSVCVCVGGYVKEINLTEKTGDEGRETREKKDDASLAEESDSSERRVLLRLTQEKGRKI